MDLCLRKTRETRRSPGGTTEGPVLGPAPLCLQEGALGEGATDRPDEPDETQDRATARIGQADRTDRRHDRELRPGWRLRPCGRGGGRHLRQDLPRLDGAWGRTRLARLVAEAPGVRG